MSRLHRVIRIFHRGMEQCRFPGPAVAPAVPGGAVPGRGGDDLVMADFVIFDLDPVSQSAPGRLEHTGPLSVGNFIYRRIKGGMVMGDDFIDPDPHGREQPDRAGHAGQLSPP